MNFEKDDCKVCEIDHEEVNAEQISLVYQDYFVKANMFAFGEWLILIELFVV